MINIYYQAFIIKTLFLSSTYFYNTMNQDNKINSLILPICLGHISNFSSFHSNTVILCNASTFSYSKSLNNLETVVSLSNNSS